MKKIIFYTLCGVLLVFTAHRLFSTSAPDIRNSSPASSVVVCFGDSLTAGYGASAGKDYPSQLSELLGMPVINAGVSGDTTRDALERLETDVLSTGPGMVFITLGGNDLKNRIPADEAFSNLRVIVEEIQNLGAMVIIGGIDIPLYGRGFGDRYRELASRTGAVLVPNVLGGIIGNRKLMSDPIHPNDAGYQVMARMFYDAVKPYL